MPLQAPANYMLQHPDPTEDVRKNVELAMNIRQSQEASQLNQLKVREGEQALGQKQVADQQAQDFYRRFQTVSQNPTPDSLLELMGMPGALPHYKELKERYDVLDERQKRQHTTVFNQAFSAADQGNSEAAAQVMEKAAEAAKNSGQAQDADTYSKYATQYRDPTQNKIAQSVVGASLATLDPKFAENYKIFKMTPGAVREQDAKADVEVNNAKFAERDSRSKIAQALGAANSSNASAAHLKEQTDELKAGADTKKRKEDAEATSLEQKAITDKEIQPLQKSAKEAEIAKTKAETRELEKKLNTLPPVAQEAALKYRDAGVSAQTATNRLDHMAKRILSEKTGFGSSGWDQILNEGYKSIRGKQDGYTALLDEYTNLMNSEILNGVSSHGAAAVIKLKQTAFPSRTASRSEIVAFINTLADARREEAKVSNANTIWTVSSPTNPAVAETDFKIGSVQVKKGDLYSDVMKKVSPQAAEEAPVSKPTSDERKVALQHLSNAKPATAAGIRALWKQKHGEDLDGKSD